MIIRRKFTALLLLTVAWPSAAEASGSVKVIVPSGPHQVKEAVSVTVRNETGKTVWYCVEVSKTGLHDPGAATGTPVPVFRVRFRKTENGKWANLLWGRDYGGASFPEELPAGQERKYNIVLSEAGAYQIELAYRMEQVSARECSQEIKRAKRSKSRVFDVSATNRGAVRDELPLYPPVTIDRRNGNLHLQIPVVATTKPKQ